MLTHNRPSRACLALATSLLMQSPARSQLRDTTARNLPEIVVQQDRISIPFLKVSQNISLIDSARIAATPARSIAEVLAFTPGLDIRQRGISGTQADVGIRGGSFEQTLVLLNGIKLSDPQTGHHMMNIPLPLEAISRIEVLKGPGARIFGQNAYAGAINIVTELPAQKALRLQAFAGDFGMHGGSVYAAMPIGRYRQAVSASYDAARGHWYNSDFRNTNLHYESAYRLNAAHDFRAMLAYSNRNFGANGFYTNSFPDQWEETETVLASLGHTFNHKQLQISSRAYWRQNDDAFRLKRHDPAFSENLHTSRVAAAELHASFSSCIGKTGLGAEARQELLHSANLGERDRLLSGLFIEHRLEFLKRFDFRAGMYSNYYSEYGWKHFPGAELGLDLSRHARLYANVGWSYRIPTYTELYYRDRSNSGNPLLKPEEAFSYEAGYKYKGAKFQAEVVGFSRNTRNLIDYYRQKSDSVVNINLWSPRNITAVQFYGLETALSYRAGLGNAHISLNTISLSYNYIHADVVLDPALETRYALSALRHQLTGSVQLAFLKRFELNLYARYLERMARDPYLVFDSRLNVRLHPKTRLFAELSNITNTDYVEAGFVQMPGRWLKAGLQLDLL